LIIDSKVGGAWRSSFIETLGVCYQGLYMVELLKKKIIYNFLKNTLFYFLMDLTKTKTAMEDQKNGTYIKNLELIR
jgi:hypothetical protein